MFTIGKLLAQHGLRPVTGKWASHWPADCFVRYRMNGQRNTGAMLQAARVVATLSVVCAIGALAWMASAAEPQVVVNVASGRHFSGSLDPASDAQKLVLRSSHGNITLWRPIRWERV